MKTLIASLFALSLLGATAADAARVGIHVGGAGVNIHVGRGHHQGPRRCHRWGYHHHQRYCRGWGW